MATTPAKRRKKSSTTNGQVLPKAEALATEDALVEDVAPKETSTKKSTTSKSTTKKRTTKKKAPAKVKSVFEDDDIEEETEAQAIRIEEPKDAIEHMSLEEAMAELRQTLQKTAMGLRDLLQTIPDTPLQHELDVERMYESITQSETFLSKPSFVVGFAGGFNAGKSMLINALLGQQILKDGAVPMTSTVTRLVACKAGEERLVIHFFSPEEFESLFEKYYEDFSWLYDNTTSGPPPHGRQELTGLLDDITFLREQLEGADWNDRNRSLDSFSDLIIAYINHQHLLSSKPVTDTLTRKNLAYYTTKSKNAVSSLVREVQIEINHPVLAEGSQLIDLPGLGSPDPRDEEITVAALRGDPQSGKRECDAVVHVMDSATPFRAGEDRLFQIYRKVWGESFSRRVFLVISRWGKLERQSPEEMLAVGNTIHGIAERYNIDSKKVFITDGRIGTMTEALSPEEEKEMRAELEAETQHLESELKQCILPSGETLFTANVQVLIDGNIPALRDAMQYYLTTYKEFLHLSDSLRVLESLVNRIQQSATLHLPPADQLEDDEEQFMVQCRNDFDRQLRQMRQKIRAELPTFLQSLLQEATIPRDLTSLCENLYQSLSSRLEKQEPEHLQQQLLTNQVLQAGPLTSPVPWETFRFLFKKAVTRLDTELEQFCGDITDQIIEQYRSFLFDDIGLLDLLGRAFGDQPEGRKILQSFQELMTRLGHDLRLTAKNLNRVYFYEYSDIYHRRDQHEARVDIRSELEEQFTRDLAAHPGEARRATRWLLRHKMEYHFQQLSTFLPLCFLQQLQEIHESMSEVFEESTYNVRQAYFGRLERREIGQEVDRIRHTYRQVKALLEHLSSLRSNVAYSRQIMLVQTPTTEKSAF